MILNQQQYKSRLKRILLTGSNSFIGSGFRKFSENDQIKEVSLIDKAPEEIDFSEIDVVLHLAALVHQSDRLPEQNYYKINRDLCLKVAGLAKTAGVKHFVFMSTVKVYGKFIQGSQPWNEDSVCLPDSTYGKSKYEAELGLQKISDEEFHVSIVRTPIVYGQEVKANMLKLIKLVRHFSILPFGNIHNKRCYTYIENLIGILDKIIEKNISGVFIAKDDNSCSTTDLIRFISKAMDKKMTLISMPHWLINGFALIVPLFVERFYGSLELDNEKTKEILNFQPVYSTAEGITNMVTSV